MGQPIFCDLQSGFWIRIHVFFGLPDLDPLVRGMDPDPALDPDPKRNKQKKIVLKN